MHTPYDHMSLIHGRSWTYWDTDIVPHAAEGFMELCPQDPIQLGCGQKLLEDFGMKFERTG
jgi:hypothetical protein